jgi:hypothetical protein
VESPKNIEFSDWGKKELAPRTFLVPRFPPSRCDAWSDSACARFLRYGEKRFVCTMIEVFFPQDGGRINYDFPWSDLRSEFYNPESLPFSRVWTQPSGTAGFIRDHFRFDRVSAVTSCHAVIPD